MSKTIRQLSLDLHITKQAIYQRMDAIDNFRNDYTTRIANRIMVDSKGEQLLKNFDNVDKYSQQDDTTKQAEQQQANNATSSDAMVLLMEQLKVKDEQLKRLQKSLDQQQQLQLATINENNNLKKQLKQLDGFDTSDTPTNEPAHTANTTNSKPKHWWQFWN